MVDGTKKDEILHDHNKDGIDRRGFLKCMAWAGTGAFCVIQGGVLKSYSLSRLSEISPKDAIGELSFVQISDSHMGFNKPANPDVAGTGAFCVIQGGVLKSYSLSRLSEISPKDAIGELSFVQISDSHMGFNKPANPDVAGTLKAAVDKINGLSAEPEFMLHTGDVSHLSKPEEFDTVEQILKDG